jgi:capsular exopolysaccharide synthesis family protein
MVVADSGRGAHSFDYLQSLWRSKWIIVLVIIIGVGATIGIDSRRSRIYTATAQVEFLSQSYGTNGDVNALEPADIATDISFMEGSKVYSLAEKSVHRGPTPPVTVSQVGESNIGNVVVSSEDPQLAAMAATAYIQAFIFVTRANFESLEQEAERPIQSTYSQLQAQVAKLELDLSAQPPTSVVSFDEAQIDSDLEQEVGLEQQLNQFSIETSLAPAGGELAARAPIPSSPSSPQRKSDAVIAFFIAFLVGSSLVLLRDRLDDRIRSQKQLVEVAPYLPILGSIPRLSKRKMATARSLVVSAAPHSAASEAYRALRTSIIFAQVDAPIRSLLVTSSLALDGKTTVSANLAYAAAEAGQSVVLVGCDLRRPSVQEIFEMPNEVGLTSVLFGTATLDEALQPVEQSKGLSVLSSGPLPPNPSELLSSAAVRSLMGTLRDRFDLVVIDSAPLLPVTDSTVLASLVDGCIVVVASGSTRASNLIRSVEKIRSVGGTIVGSVFNKALVDDSYYGKIYYPE